MKYWGESPLRRQKKWLPDLDLNQDKLNQNQLCYRYTIGQNRRQYTALLAKIKPGIEKKRKKAVSPCFDLTFSGRCAILIYLKVHSVVSTGCRVFS